MLSDYSWVMIEKLLFITWVNLLIKTLKFVRTVFCSSFLSFSKIAFYAFVFPPNRNAIKNKRHSLNKSNLISNFYSENSAITKSAAPQSTKKF